MNTAPGACAQAAPRALADQPSPHDIGRALELTLDPAPAAARRLTDARIAALVPVPQPVEFHHPIADDKRALFAVRPRPTVAQLLRLVDRFRRPVPRGLWA